MKSGLLPELRIVAIFFAVFSSGMLACGDADTPMGEDSGVVDIGSDIPGETADADSTADSSHPSDTGPDISDAGRDNDAEPVDGGVDAVVSDVTDLDVFLTGTARIYGRAYYTNHNDSSGITVCLLPKDGTVLDSVPQPSCLATAVTEKNGTYLISRVPAGLYNVALISERFSQERSKIWGVIKATEGKTETIPDLKFTAVGNITGGLLYQGNSDVFFDPVVFDPERKHRGLIHYPDAEQLTFSMDRLLPGEYSVCIGAPGFDGRCLDSVKVNPAEDTDVGPVMLVQSTDSSPGVTVEGRAALAGFSPGPGITVTANPGPDQITVITDSEGGYRFDNIPSGANLFMFSAPINSGYERNSGYHERTLYAGTREVLGLHTLEKGEALWRTDPEGLAATRSTFTPDSKSVLFTAINPELYDYNRLSRLVRVDLESDAAVAVAQKAGRFWISPDSSTVVYEFSSDPALLFAAPVNGGESRLLTTEVNEYGGVLGFTGDSRYVLFQKSPLWSENDREVGAFDLVNGISYKVCSGQYWPVMNPGLAGRVISCLSDDDVLVFADVVDGTTILSTHRAVVPKTSPDGNLSFVCDPFGPSFVLNLVDGTTFELEEPVSDCEKVLWMPSSEGLAYAGEQGNLNLISASTGAVLAAYDLEGWPLAFSSDSSTLAFATISENELYSDLWGVRFGDGMEPAMLLGHEYWYFGTPERDADPMKARVRLSADGSTLFVERRQPDSLTLELVKVPVAANASPNSLGYLCGTDCQGHTIWILDDARGVLYLARDKFRLETIDLRTGDLLYFAESGSNLDGISPDMSHVLVRALETRLLFDIRLPDLTTTPVSNETEWLNPNSIGESSADKFLWAPDSSSYIYLSDFKAEPTDVNHDYRLMYSAAATR